MSHENHDPRECLSCAISEAILNHFGTEEGKLMSVEQVEETMEIFQQYMEAGLERLIAEGVVSEVTYYTEDFTRPEGELLH